MPNPPPRPRPTPSQRKVAVGVNLTPEQAQYMRGLMERYGISPSQTIRALVEQARRRDEQLEGDVI